ERDDQGRVRARGRGHVRGDRALAEERVLDRAVVDLERERLGGRDRVWRCMGGATRGDEREGGEPHFLSPCGKNFHAANMTSPNTRITTPQMRFTLWPCDCEASPAASPYTMRIAPIAVNIRPIGSRMSSPMIRRTGC